MPPTLIVEAASEEPQRVGLMHDMCFGLHELSQPMTALLCLLEYGSSLEASDELKQVMKSCTEAMERLRTTVISMQLILQEEEQR